MIDIRPLEEVYLLAYTIGNFVDTTLFFIPSGSTTSWARACNLPSMAKHIHSFEKENARLKGIVDHPITIDNTLRQRIIDLSSNSTSMLMEIKTLKAIVQKIKASLLVPPSGATSMAALPARSYAALIASSVARTVSPNNLLPFWNSYMESQRYISCPLRSRSYHVVVHPLILSSRPSAVRTLRPCGRYTE